MSDEIELVKERVKQIEINGFLYNRVHNLSFKL